MFKLLLSPVIAGCAYGVCSYCGSDAEQLIHQSPSVTYGAFEQALGNVRQSGTTSFDGGAPVPYEIHVDRTLDQKLVVTLYFDGKRGAEADFDFAPRDSGNITLVTTHIHADRSVLRPVLAGTAKARMAYAPDWMLNLTFKPVLKQLGEQIDQGKLARFDMMSEGEAEANWEQNLSDDQKQQMSDWRQYDATRPSTDPDGSAQQYMNGSSASSSN